MTKPYLIGLDLGTSSIGYAVFGIDENEKPVELLDVGVRIFPDGRDAKTKEPLAVARRVARGIRRTRDRGQNRVRRLVKELIDFGLLPSDEKERAQIFASVDPYQARSLAVNSEVSATVLGRALFHIGRRRGFKSNRLSGDSEETAFKEKISGLRSKLGDQTLGEYLFARSEENRVLREKGQPTDQKVFRFRGGETEFYADRQMYLDEWQKIREVQGNRFLTDAQWDALHETAFWQYPLRPVPKGKCRFYPDEPRASAGLPLAQQFRIYQEVNNLRYVSQGEEHYLSDRQRFALYDYLNENKSISFSSIAKRLKDEHKSPYFPSDAQFNLATEGRDKLIGNEVLIDLRKDRYLGKLADTLDVSKLNDLVAFLIDPVKEEKERMVVMEAEEVEAEISQRLPQLPPDQVGALANMHFKRDTMSVSRKFMEQLVPVLKTGLIYSDAVLELGKQLGTNFHHSYFKHEELDRLPYYGQVLVESVWGAEPEADKDKPESERDNDAYQFGKIANPTVHVSLNQLRVVVNRIIDKMGDKPVKIHVELTRDLKNSKDERAKLQREMAKNKKDRERIAKELKENHNIDRPSREDFQKYKLWEELGEPRQTIFTGKTIAASQLFNGEVEIEHIVPFSRCFDDGMSNKTLAFKNENNIKGNRTPAEVSEFNQADMLKRALKAFKQSSKYERFKDNAFEKFYGGEKGNMIERQLNDTRYISRKAAQYLNCLFPSNKNKVVSVNGRLTAVLRDVWQLNHFKDKEAGNYREDHRHHLVDAFVVGLTSRRLIQQLSSVRELNRQTENNLYRFVKSRVSDIPELRTQLKELQEYVVASYKPDHTHQGSMFNDTAYGVREHTDEKQIYGLTRKPVSSLSFSEVFQVCGKSHQLKLVHYLTGSTNVENAKELKELVGSDKDLQVKLAEFSQTTGIKKIRIRVPNNSIARIGSAPFKGYARNSYAYCDVWQVPHKKDKKTGKWSYKYQGVFIPYADVKAHSDNPENWRPHPAAKKLMRLYKNDNIRLVDRETGETKVMRVAGYDSGKNKFDVQDNLVAKSEKQNHVSINQIFIKNQIKKLWM